MDNNNKELPYIGIGRASTVIQKNSLEIQFNAIKKWSEENKIPVILESKNFVFESGRTRNRTTVADALALIREKKVKGIVFTRLDRLGRSTEEICRIVREVIEADGDIVGVEQGFDTRSAIGMFVLRSLASFAELEHALISERIAEGKAAKKAKKGYVSKNDIGWGQKLERGKIVIDYRELEIMERIVELKKTMSWNKMAELFTTEAVPKRKVKTTKWCAKELQLKVESLNRLYEKFPGLATRQKKEEQVA